MTKPRYEFVSAQNEKGIKLTEMQGVWQLPIEDELATIRMFHEATTASGGETGNQILLYKDGKRILRVSVRDFNDFDEKLNAFANAMLGLCVFEADEAIVFCDVWASKMQLANKEADDVLQSNLINATDMTDRMKALIVCVINRDGFSSAVLGYETHDGMVTWAEDVIYFPVLIPAQNTDTYLGGVESASKSVQWMTATGGDFTHTVTESYLTRFMHKTLNTPKPQGVTEETVKWFLGMQGYTIKEYEADANAK